MGYALSEVGNPIVLGMYVVQRCRKFIIDIVVPTHRQTPPARRPEGSRRQGFPNLRRVTDAGGLP
ncbi:hypothetical protein [Nocardia asiatica]|uniref:hypothetical protein n=1 Tax=Nocardia asiatica TaxID=209252 RepID=UPI003EE016AE